MPDQPRTPRDRKQLIDKPLEDDDGIRVKKGISRGAEPLTAVALNGHGDAQAAYSPMIMTWAIARCSECVIVTSAVRPPIAEKRRPAPA